MEQRFNLAKTKFETYYASFEGLAEEQKKNFAIKKDHSLRVAEMTLHLAEQLNLSKEEKYLAYLIGLFHDIGRFKQLVDYNTFDDTKSVDHAGLSLEVLKEQNYLSELSDQQTDIVLCAIEWHNKRELPKNLSEEKLLFARLIRDADKLDIFKVLCDYYTNPKAIANHTLTWEMPKGSVVSPTVKKQILKGGLVAKENITNELDIKVMQLSWVYDFNFKASFNEIISKRYLEKIYNSMPKNDSVIEIYRRVKVYSQNKFIA